MSAFAYQLSIKIGSGYDAHLVNIQADSAAEFIANLQAVPGIVSESIAGAIAHITGAGHAAPLTVPQAAPQVPAAGFTNVAQPTAPYVPPAQPAYQAPAQPAAAPVAGPAGVAPVCQHGTKVFKTSKPGGRQWQAWMCPSPKGTADQCSPAWID